MKAAQGAVQVDFRNDTRIGCGDGVGIDLRLRISLNF